MIDLWSSGHNIEFGKERLCLFQKWWLRIIYWYLHPYCKCKFSWCMVIDSFEIINLHICEMQTAKWMAIYHILKQIYQVPKLATKKKRDTYRSFRDPMWCYKLYCEGKKYPKGHDDWFRKLSENMQSYTKEKEI